MVGTACKVALGLMVFFALLGRQILDVLGTGIPSLCVGCGILTAATGFSMLCSSDGPADESAGSVGFGSQRPNLAITPLAVPLIAGPYPIAEIVERAALLRSLCDWIALLASIFLAVGCVALLLNIAGKLVDSLGKTLPKLFFRISGLVLLSMAVQFILVGLEQIEPFARLLSGRC
jgi:multiple antibiotic resistance protein